MGSQRWGRAVLRPNHGFVLTDTLRYAQTWIHDNREKYRIQRFASSK